MPPPTKLPPPAASVRAAHVPSTTTTTAAATTTAASTAATPFARSLYASLQQIHAVDSPSNTEELLDRDATSVFVSAIDSPSALNITPSQLEWLESALTSSATFTPTAFWSLLQRLNASHVLSSSELRQYRNLVDRGEVITNDEELDAAVEASAGGVRAEREEEEEASELEAEIESLQQRQNELSQRISASRLSVQQLSTALERATARRSALVAVNSEEKEEQQAAAVAAAKRAVDTTDASIVELRNTVSRAQRAVFGDRSAPTHSGALRPAAQTIEEELPRIVAADTLAISPPARAAAYTTASAAATKADDPHSPFMHHHTSLLQSYLTADAQFADSCNRLFRCYFSAATAAEEEQQRLQQKHSADEEHMQAQIVDLLSTTPYAAKVRSLLPLPRQSPSAADKQQPQKGSIRDIRASPMQQSKSVEEKEQKEQMKTPPSRTAIVQQPLLPPPSSSSSSLTPSERAYFHSELSRLHSAFPKAQQHWLLANLKYIGQKAKVDKMQRQSVVERRERQQMDRQKMNESIASLTITHLSLLRSLSTLVTSTFPSLWEQLAKLQLLEVLRVDVSMRQGAHATEEQRQKRMIQLLQRQLVRHNLLLARCRVDRARIEELKELIVALVSELEADAAVTEETVAAQKRMKQHQLHHRSLISSDRLTVDARHTQLKRLEDVIRNCGRAIEACRPLQQEKELSDDEQSAAAIRRRLSGGVAEEQQTQSYATLLEAATALSSAGRRLTEEAADIQTQRKEVMRQLNDAAKSVREVLFDDRCDVGVQRLLQRSSDAASATASSTDINLTRINKSQYEQLMQSAINAVEAAGDDLNAAIQPQQQQLSLLGVNVPDSQLNPNAAVDRELRHVFCEFILQPDMLDARMQRLQQAADTARRY